jgi:hypothetical protein
MGLKQPILPSIEPREMLESLDRAVSSPSRNLIDLAFLLLLLADLASLLSLPLDSCVKSSYVAFLCMLNVRTPCLMRLPSEHGIILMLGIWRNWVCCLPFFIDEEELAILGEALP